MCHLGPKQDFHDDWPCQLAVVGCLDLFTDSTERLLQGIFATRVEHFLFHCRVIWTPKAETDVNAFVKFEMTTTFNNATDRITQLSML